MVKVRKARGLSRQQLTGLEGDHYEEDDKEYRPRRAVDDEEDDDPGMGTVVEDEEISSDDDDDLPVTKRKKKRQSDSDDEQSIGSSVDPDDLQDLSHMLSDDDNDEDDAAAGDSEDESRDDGQGQEASTGLLAAIGLRGRKGPFGARGERTEIEDESTGIGRSRAGQLSVDALLGSLEQTGASEQLKRDLTKTTSGSASKKRGDRGLLSAPMEVVDKRRLERRTATEVAQREVSEWDQAVRTNRDAEKLSFPLDRQGAIGGGTAALSAIKPRTELEKGIDALLAQHQLDEKASAAAEQLEM